MKIAVAGCTGRMGRALIHALTDHKDLRLSVALDQPNATQAGKDAGFNDGTHTGVLITSDLEALTAADCLIDFTRPAGTLRHLKVCRRLGVKMVIGTTGFDEAGSAAIREAAAQIAVVWAPNMSLGVNVTLELLALAAKLLGQQAQAEIFELHHGRKVDAPSGTALRMGEVIAQNRGQTLSDVAQWQRHGHTGERNNQDIGFSVARGGDVIGDHTAFFLMSGERIEITHRSSSRSTYAHGALAAAQFLRDHERGLFDMRDVLGARDPATNHP